MMWNDELTDEEVDLLGNLSFRKWFGGHPTEHP